jgi:hypothetical protein
MIPCTCSADRLQPTRGGRGQRPSPRSGSANASSQPTVYQESGNLQAVAEVDNQAPAPGTAGAGMYDDVCVGTWCAGRLRIHPSRNLRGRHRPVTMNAADRSDHTDRSPLVRRAEGAYLFSPSQTRERLSGIACRAVVIQLAMPTVQGERMSVLEPAADRCSKRRGAPCSTGATSLSGACAAAVARAGQATTAVISSTN